MGNVYHIAGAVALVLLAALFARLGFWQMERADQADALSRTLVERPSMPPLALGPDGPHEQLLPLRRAVAHGRFEARHRILIDNRKQDGQLGRHEIVPLRLSGSDTRVLVNRGWVPREDAVPDDGATERTVHGLLAQPELPALRLGPPAGEGDILPYLDPGELAAARGYPVLPLILVEDPRVAQDLLEGQQERSGKWGMHIGYAVQWFVFAALALALPFVLARRGRGVAR